MISINLTLVLQAVHFLIAYCILDWLLLRKAVAIVQQEEQVIATVQEEVAFLNNEIDQKNEEQLRQWHQMQHELMLQRPSVDMSSFMTVKRLFAYEPPVTEKELAHLKSEAARAIVERIVHEKSSL